MNLQLHGMSDKVYNQLLDEITDIRWLVMKAGRMATKTVVEDVLMERYNCNRGDAHTLLNYSENINSCDIVINRDGAQWLSNRPMPKIQDWPEIRRLNDS